MTPTPFKSSFLSTFPFGVGAAVSHVQAPASEESTSTAPQRRKKRHLGAALALSLLIAPLLSIGCAGGEPSNEPDLAPPPGMMTGVDMSGAGADAAALDDVVAKAEDFTCVLKWPKVRMFRITNLLGNTAASVAVANAPGNGNYPVGTLIQLVPTEAMVKRKAGFNPASNDWEFFFLTVAAEGTTITARGTDKVVNAFNGNCLNCHKKAEPKYDFVCEKGHGCDKLPFGDDVILKVQDADPRCK